MGLWTGSLPFTAAPYDGGMVEGVRPESSEPSPSQTPSVRLGVCFLRRCLPLGVKSSTGGPMVRPREFEGVVTVEGERPWRTKRGASRYSCSLPPSVSVAVSIAWS